MTFKFSGSASAFCQGPQSHVRAVVFSFFFFFLQGHLFQAGPEERQRGEEWGVVVVEVGVGVVEEG